MRRSLLFVCVLTLGCAADVLLGARDPSAITAGASFTCFIDEAATLRCWGGNDAGQIGDGTTMNRLVPQLVMPRARAVGAGGAHTCAVTLDDEVRCWGRDVSGQLGDGALGPPTPSPARSFEIEGVTAIAGGGEHTCAIAGHGRVWCWGANEVGQLGDGTTTPTTAATAVLGIDDAIAIAAGFSHTCVLRRSGAIACWGEDANGQLGDGGERRASATPVVVVGIGDGIAIAVRSGHSCALRADGDVWCWGRDDHHQLGDGEAAAREAPVRSALSPAIAIGVGLAHTCAIDAAGAVRCVGLDEDGQLDGVAGGPGASSRVPILVPGVTGARSLAAGNDHTCALLDDGSVRCWGSDALGQLGDD